MAQFEGTVGLVGGGAMGFPIMRHMLAEGLSVVCNDLSAEALESAEKLGASPARSPEQLANCGVLLVFVPTDADVRAVAADYARVVRQDGGIFVIHSSVRTATAQEIGAELADSGIRVVDAALTGGVRGAENGEISLHVGGAPEDVARLQPVFAPWTMKVNHLGTLGMGQVGKTVNNLIHWAQITGIVEALSLGAQLGVPAAQMREALTGGTTDSRTLQEIQDMRFTWYEKDIDNAMEMARAIGVELSLAPLIQERMRSINVNNVAELLAGTGVISLPTHS